MARTPNSRRSASSATQTRWSSAPAAPLIASAVALTCGLACSGTISDLGGFDDDSSSSSSNGSVPEGAARSPDEAGYEEGDTGGLFDKPASATRFARLTHTQWENSVRDLFGLDDTTQLAQDLRSDPKLAGFIFENDASTLEVDEALWRGYQRAATDVAAMVTGDSALLDAILPPDTGDDAARARAFIAEMGERVHRRPLTDQQIADYEAIYAAAAGLYPGMSDFDAGVRLLIEAFVQSPHFIYRIEDSTEAVGDVIPLDGFEIASRLSYALWNTMPDADLFAAARAGDLDRADLVAAQAVRMLDDPRAESVVASFHEQLFDVDTFDTIRPSPAFFPDVSDALGLAAIEEHQRFVREIVFGRGGSFVDLLTSSETFVNDELAGVYGLSGSYGADFELATLPADQRKGLLTQVGFLAHNATSVNPDPIHRGVFVAKRMACAKIAAPPADVPPLPPVEGRTNRETVEDHTQKPDTACAGCHATVINPFGFPFENYDASGAWRTTDNGYPVDASSEATIGSERVAVDDALGLIDALVASEVVHQCYTQHWVEFAYSRPKADVDDSLIQRLGQRSLDEGLSVKDLIVGLVKTEAFLTRSVEELP